MTATKRRGTLGGIGALAALAVLSACGSATAFLRSSPPTTSASTPTSPTPHVVPHHPTTPPHSTSPTRAVTPTHPSSPATNPPPLPIQVPGCPFPAAAPITSAPGFGKTVALTFDDGAGPYTPQILAILVRFHVKATFFDTGLHDSTYPQYARQVVAAGDEIGNHTFHHYENWGFHTYFTPEQQRLELTSTNAVLKPLIGHDPCVMRPPGGAYDPVSLALVRSLGMSMAMWTTDTEDWQQPPYLSKAFQLQLLHRAEAGADLTHPILLMHAAKASHEPDCAPSGCATGQVSSFRGNTVAALPLIIQFYLAHGYRFVTLS